MQNGAPGIAGNMLQNVDQENYVKASARPGFVKVGSIAGILRTACTMGRCSISRSIVNPIPVSAWGYVLSGESKLLLLEMAIGNVHAQGTMIRAQRRSRPLIHQWIELLVKPKRTNPLRHCELLRSRLCRSTPDKG